MAKKIYPEIELTIDSIGFEGVSIARHDGKVHFIQGGIPGDRVLCSIHKNKSKYAEGTIKQVLIPGQGRIQPACSHFGVCGGCKWQHLVYEEQLHWKKSHVVDCFERIAKIPFDHVYDTMPSAKVYHYRNKMEFSFGASRWLTADEMGNESLNTSFAVGLHVPGRFDKVLDVDTCHIADLRNQVLLSSIRDKADELSITAHHAREHHGFLRNIIMRTNREATQLMIGINTSYPLYCQILLRMYGL
jgi:23S rRNA (uracil1939-C5)-methyltransferase